jgi:hypothetical protein
MTERLKIERGSGNVFLDIGFSPEEARALGVTQPRLNDLLRGKIDKFSLDALVNMLAHAGMRVEMKVKKAA